MTLYLQSILSSKSSGIITLEIPVISSDGSFKTETLQGYLTEDVQFDVQNEWGNIIPNLESLQSISQIVGSTDILCWIAATEAGWKGTSPIDLSVEFYMYSIDKNSKIKEKVKSLLKLASMYTSGDVTVEVHGGYKPYYMRDNGDYLGDSVLPSQNIINNAKQYDEQGTVKIKIGDQLYFDKLLLVKASTTHSNVEVAKGEPLYIKVNAQFRGRKALMTNDIDTIYG